MDQTAWQINTALQVAIRTNNYTFEYASGVQNHLTGKHIKVDDIVPLGSLTKSFTAAGIVQSIQSGKMGWNDTISSHINEIGILDCCVGRSAVR